VAGQTLIAPTLGGVFYVDFAADANGNIAGVLYSNRDSTGVLGGEIECGGSKTATWYGMVAFLGGKAGPEVAVYARNSGLLDISTITPITTQPVIVAPTGDGTYLRLDGGNGPLTGDLTLTGAMTSASLTTGSLTILGPPTINFPPQAPCIFEGSAGLDQFSSATDANGVDRPMFADSTGSGCMEILTARSTTGLVANSFPGADIGAQINAAAATCISGAQCHIVIAPAAQQSFSTPIVYVDNETIECTATGTLDNTTATNFLANLNYTGSAVAVTMGARSGRFKGCGLLLSSTTTTGILLAAYGGKIEDADIRGGGATTKLINASGSALSTNVDDVEIINSRINAFTGIAVACDNVNDLRIMNVSAVGIVSNTTNVMLLVDSACTGVTVSDYFGYNTGLHGLFMRKTLTGLPPQSFFFRNFESDLASSDGFLFDSTLGSFPLHFACDNCWAAGSGGAGIHVAGGAEISFSHAQIRSNAHDGVLIDGALVEEVMITSSLIGGNNTANGGFNGISIRNHPAQIVIVGNEISSATETGGFQQYAINAYADVEGLVFSSNDCGQNVVTCANLASVVASKLTYSGNMNVVSGISSEPSFFPGPVQIKAVAVGALPTCTSALEGTSWPVNNTTTTTYNATIVTGGSNHMNAYCNGSAWVAH
jgi:hypothetical protein